MQIRRARLSRLVQAALHDESNAVFNFHFILFNLHCLLALSPLRFAAKTFD